MDKKFANPDMLLLARESRGLTQKEVAERLHVTQATISKAEKLPGKASEVLLAALASELGYPVDFFYRTGGRYEPAVLHRKQASLPQGVRHRIEANANVTLLHIRSLMDSVELPPLNVPAFSVEDFPEDGIEGVARAVRVRLRLPAGPVNNMVNILENLGIILAPRHFESEKLDAFTMISRDCTVIFFNQAMPWCRIRFSLAHELGHLVLGHMYGQTGIEDEANTFASAFLMPKTDISRVFNTEKIDLSFLAALKPHWKVSIQALLRRAYDLEWIGRPSYEHMCRQISVLGYRKREPEMLDVPAEQPGLLRHMILLHLNDLGYSKQELCEVLCTTVKSFESLYPEFAEKPQDPRFRRVK